MIRIGLVGCGFMGRMHASVYKLLPNAHLVAVADRNPSKAEAFGAEFGVRAHGSLEALLEAGEIDALDICLPTHLHADATVKAAGAGLHVLCEKPMALSVEDADKMIAASEHHGVRLMIAHCIRFWPEYVRLKEAVDSGEHGKLLSLNLTRYGQFPSWSSDNWLADESLSGGGVLDMHIHDTDFALHLLGEPDSVESWGTVDSRGASHAFTTMQFGTTVVHLEGGWNLPPGAPFKMAFRAVFERGAMIFDGGPLTIYRENGEQEVPTFVSMSVEGGGNISDLGGYFYEIDYFVTCLSNGSAMERVTPSSARLSLFTTLREIAQIKDRSAIF